MFRHEFVGLDHAFHAQPIHLDDAVERFARLGPLAHVVILVHDDAGRRVP